MKLGSLMTKRLGIPVLAWVLIFATASIVAAEVMVFTGTANSGYLNVMECIQSEDTINIPASVYPGQEFTAKIIIKNIGAAMVKVRIGGVESRTEGFTIIGNETEVKNISPNEQVQFDVYIKVATDITTGAHILTLKYDVYRQ